MSKEGAIVLHSGGMDSSLCLALALEKYGPKNVYALCFSYGQRHEKEVEQARSICHKWALPQKIIDLSSLQVLIPSNALTNRELVIEKQRSAPASTMVLGRNGLMAHLGGLYAHGLGCKHLYMGLMELEEANSGYRDCSRAYIDLKQAALRLDLDCPDFCIHTPLVHMTKKETMHVGYKLGVLDFLLQQTITCYEGIMHAGCMICPACRLRNEGLYAFCKNVPSFRLPYSLSSSPSYSSGASVADGMRK